MSVPEQKATINDNTFALQATSVQNTFGLFYMGDSQTFQPFGDCAIRCIAGNSSVRRFQPAMQAMGGTATRVIDFFTDPGDDITGGSTWNFQYWFRAQPVFTDNFDMTDGLSVLFAP